jgi:aspartate 1-decarboxylase
MLAVLKSGIPLVATATAIAAAVGVAATEHTTVSGSVTEVFHHRFVLETEKGKLLVDLTPKGAAQFAVKRGDQVVVEGEQKPSELKVIRIGNAPDKLVAISRPKDDERPKEPVMVSGTVTDVFSHRLVLQTDTGKMLVDLTPKGAAQYAVKQGDQIIVEGKQKPTELKAIRIGNAPDKLIIISDDD